MFLHSTLPKNETSSHSIDHCDGIGQVGLHVHYKEAKVLSTYICDRACINHPLRAIYNLLLRACIAPRAAKHAVPFAVSKSWVTSAVYIYIGLSLWQK